MTNPRPDQMSDDELRREVKAKRTEVAADVDALTDKIDPDNVRREAKDAVRSAKDRAVTGARSRVTTRAQKMSDGIRENPWPFALIAGGVGWLLVDRYVSQAYTPRLDEAKRRARQATHRAAGAAIHRTSRLGVKAREMGDEGGGGAGERIQDMRERADARWGDLRARADARYHDARHRASLKMQDARVAAEHARDRGSIFARDAGARAQGFYADSPLVVGGIALALGLGVGLALPASRREMDMIGDQSQQLRNRARDLGRELKEDVSDIARTTAKRTAETAKETVRNEAHSHHLDDPKVKLGLGDTGRTTQPGLSGESAAPRSGNGGPTSTPNW